MIFSFVALILRGLDALTTEETLVTALNKVSAVQIKNIRVIRDEATGTSRGYAVVELCSITESSQLLELLQQQQQPFEVDGKGVIAAYSKNTFSTM